MLVLCLFLPACSNHKTGSSSARQGKKIFTKKDLKAPFKGRNVTLKKDYIIGKDTSNALLENNAGFAVDDTGHIFYANWQSRTIDEFSGDSLVQQMGRKGKGPGEFQYIEGICVRGHKLYVMDGGLLRISVFDTRRGKLSKTINLKKLSSPTKHGAMPGGINVTYGNQPEFILDYTIPYSPGTSDIKRTQKFVLMNASGKVLKNPVIKVPADQRYVNDTGSSIMVGPLPFGRKAVVRLSPDNHFYYGWTDSLAIQVYAMDGTLKGTIRHPVKKQKVTHTDIDTVLNRFGKNYRKQLRNAHFAKTFPAFENLLIDSGGRLWVKTHTTDMSVVQWLILNKKGKKEGSVYLPADLSVKKIRHGYLYATRNASNGVPLIVRYKINSSF